MILAYGACVRDCWHPTGWVAGCVLAFSGLVCVWHHSPGFLSDVRTRAIETTCTQRDTPTRPGETVESAEDPAQGR